MIIILQEGHKICCNWCLLVLSSFYSPSLLALLNAHATQFSLFLSAPPPLRLPYFACRGMAALLCSVLSLSLPSPVSAAFQTNVIGLSIHT